MEAEHPQDWRRSLGLICVALVLQVSTISHVAAFAPLYMSQELRLGDADVALWTGLIAGLPLALALCIAPFWGVWADRYNAKLIIVRANFFLFVVFLGLVFASNLPQMFVAAMFIGLTYGAVAVLMAVQAGITPTQRVGFALSAVNGCGTLGQSLGPLAGSYLIPVMGLRGLFALDAVLVIVSALMFTFGLKEPKHAPRSGTMLSQMGLTLRQAWTMPAMRWSFVTMFFLMAGQTAIQPYIPVFLGQYYQGAELARMIGIVLGAAGSLTAIFTPLAGIIGDRAGHGATGLAILIVLLIIHVLLFILAGPVALVVLLMFRNVPQSGIMATLNSIIAIRAPAGNRAALISLAPLPRNAGMFLGPVLASSVSQVSLVALFPFAAGLFAFAIGASLLLNRSERAVPKPIAVTSNP